MEAKKSSFVDDFFPQTEPTSPSKSDILSSIFPPLSPVTPRDSFHHEFLPTRARKKGNEEPSSSEKFGALGGNFHINPIKSHNVLKKNTDPIMPCELAEPCLMSSSVFYGGREDFIPESSSSYNSGSTYNCKDEREDANNSDLANRGEWWQGSFYY